MTSKFMAFKRRADERQRRRRNATIVTIESPRSQTRKNSERAAQAASEAREKQRRQQAKAIEERDRIDEEERLKRAEQKRLAQAAESIRAGAVPVKELKSVKQRRATGSTVTLQPPASESVVSFDELQSAHTAFSTSGFERVFEEVRARRDAAVLCANGGGKVETWNTLLNTPSPEDDMVTEWRKWLSPANWRGFIDMCAELDPDIQHDNEEEPAYEIQMAAVSGAYNAVMTPSSIAKLDDARRWPPQLADAGHSNAYVVRMTKTRPFPPGPPGLNGKPPAPVYRFMPLKEMVLEMALALYAASLEVGPPVLAAVSWPEETVDPSRLHYGLLLILGRERGDMLDYQSALRSKFPPVSYVSGPSEAYGRAATNAAKDVARLCYRTAREGFLNFDIKPANILWHEDDSFHLCDFDPTHFVHVSNGVASTKAAFFVNMLLLCMHVRSHSSDAFSSVFLAPISHALLGLWQEAVRKPELFGAGADWLKAARLPPDARAGCFCARELRTIRNVGTRCKRHFEMLVFEYGFSSSEGRRPPRRCTAWPGWQRSTASSSFFGAEVPLVPQLLCYCFFYSKPVPAELASILGKNVDAR